MKKFAVMLKVAGAALALTVAAGLGVAVGPAAPAGAACSSVVEAKYNTRNGSIVGGWKLMQNSTCTERWGQIVVDYQPDPTGLPYAILVERQIYSPYGYYTQATYTKISGIGSEGTWNTTHTKYTGGTDDRHRICWGWATWNGSSYVAPAKPENYGANCTAWRY